MNDTDIFGLVVLVLAIIAMFFIAKRPPADNGPGGDIC